MGLFLVLAFSLAGSGGVPQSMGVNNSFGEIKIKRMVAPDFSLDLYDDREIRLSELRGNVVVLDFWSSWCSPCRKEAAVLAEVYLEYRDKGVVFLGISIWDRDEDALAHIERYGSGHSEAIVTRDYGRAMQFLDAVDASAVLVNASTRFNDGEQLGLGAEVAISTNKLHARGPMGLRDLTSYKWVILGNGHIRE